MWATITGLFPSDFNFSPSEEPAHELIRPVPETRPVNPNDPCRSSLPETLNQWRHPPPAGRSSAFVHFANSKKNEDNDKAVKVYKRHGERWDFKELEQPATFEELGTDPENNNGIISDLLTFVMEKESHKKVGKAWTRCYVLYEPPGTDRSSLIGAMANYLKFDIYNVDLMTLSSISELKKVLGSTQNHSLIAIQDYNLWLSFPQSKNQLTVPCLLKIIDNVYSSRGDEHIIVFTTNHRGRHDDAAPVDTDMHIYTSSPWPSALSSEIADTNQGAHLVRQDQSRSTGSHSDKKRTRGPSNSEGKTPSISLEVLQQHFGSTRKQAADNLEVSVSTFKRICRQHGIERWQNRKRNEVFGPRDQHGEGNMSTLWETPSQNVQPGMDGESVGQNQEANMFGRDFMEGPIAMNTKSGLIMVSRPPDQYGERNPSIACEAPLHNVQTGIGGEPVGQNQEANEFRRDFTEGSIALNTENGLIIVLRPPDPHGEKNPSPMFKTPSTIGQITVENEMGSQNPEPNEFQLDSFEDMNFRNTETGSMAEMPSDWEDLLALEEELFPERNVSGSTNLTVVARSDTTPCQQPMPTIPDTMPPIYMMPHLACSDPAPCQQPMLTISNTMPTIHMLPHFAAREDMTCVTLKVTYGKEKILKFKFPLMSGIIELKEEVKKRLKLELGSFDIKYEDEEGDRIFLACDEDLRDHLQLFSNQVIRLLVVDSDANT